MVVNAKKKIKKMRMRMRFMEKDSEPVNGTIRRSSRR